MGNSCISIFANKKTKSPSQAFSYQQHIGTHMPRCTSFMPLHVTILTHAPHNDGDASTRSFFFGHPRRFHLLTYFLAIVISHHHPMLLTTGICCHPHAQISPTCSDLITFYIPKLRIIIQATVILFQPIIRTSFNLVLPSLLHIKSDYAPSWSHLLCNSSYFQVLTLSLKGDVKDIRTQVFYTGVLAL